jgi:tetratricopeptide (TPR) repeat protein
LALWLLGYPEQALRMADDAVRLAERLAHAPGLAHAFAFVTYLHQFRREVHRVRERAEALIALCSEQGVEHFLAAGIALRGWALVQQQGRAPDGIAEIRRGLASGHAAGIGITVAYLWALLADAHRQTGDVEEGLKAADAALAEVASGGMRFWEPEMLRLKGELLMLQAGSEVAAERCIRDALDGAHRQSAKSLELRAAVSLTRLRQSQGRRAEAHALLAPIYAWFTEGLDTADLREAKALLDELS